MILLKYRKKVAQRFWRKEFLLEIQNVWSAPIFSVMKVLRKEYNDFQKSIIQVIFKTPVQAIPVYDEEFYKTDF